jgi:hypothetical protein
MVNEIKMNDNREIFEVPVVLAKMIFFLFIMETSSLEARNIRFVNSNLSRVQESKLIPAS